MLPLEHSAILLTCIKSLLVLKTIFGLLFEWLLKTGFTVHYFCIVGLPNSQSIENIFMDHKFLYGLAYEILVLLSVTET